MPIYEHGAVGIALAAIVVATAAALMAAPAPATPSGLRVTALAPTRVTLAWNAARHAAGYDLFRDGVALASGPATTYADAAVAAATPYAYQVRSRNPQGVASPLSPALLVTTPPASLAVPPPPTGLSLSLAGTAAAPVVLGTWNASPGATGYDVYRNGVLGLGNIAATGFSDPVQPGATYTYGVDARNAAGVSAQGAPASITVPAAGGGPSAGTTQAFLLDFDSTAYDWAVVAPHYRVIALNAWNYPWIPAIRAANPQALVFVYKDLTSTRTSACQNGVDMAELPTGIGYCWAQAHHPEWFLRNASGGLLAEAGYPTQFEMDYGNPAYQQQWASNVVADLLAHGWDGVLMDNALTTHDAYGVSPSYPTDAATQAATAAMLTVVGQAIKAAGKLAVANVGYDTRYPGLWRAWLPLLSGLMDEFTWSWSTAIDQSVPDWNIFEDEVAACAAAGALCLFHVGAYTVLPASLVTFAVASYLLHADGSSVLGPGEMLYSNYPELFTALGAPRGAAYLNAAGHWQRDFAGGSVTVDLSNWTATVT